MLIHNLRVYALWLSVVVCCGSVFAAAPLTPTEIRSAGVSQKIQSLSGTASPRAARSVHLSYQVPKASAFYNELTVEQSTRGSYFMACGFQDGYFGIQDLGGGRKVVLFSVWDAESGDNPDTVQKEKKAEIIFKAPEVRTGRFGGEGTGVQSVFDYNWKVGQTCRFLVKVVDVAGELAYAAYFYIPETKSWKHLATLHAPHNKSYLTGLYSFVEDFRRDKESVNEVRRALFGQGAFLNMQGGWRPLDKACFTASPAPWEAKDNINAGPDGRGFFLQTGGDTRMQTPLGTVLQQNKKFTPPVDLPKD
ncbi:MAG: DUF3472 domain-containing protein [bacterium]